MLATEIKSVNTFKCAPTPVEPEIIPNVVPIKIDEKMAETTTNGYDSNNEYSNINGKDGAAVVPGRPANDVVGQTANHVTQEEVFEEEEYTFEAFQKLRTELERAQSELRTRNATCESLSRVREEVDLEIEELTASLFEEAHKMVNEANVGRASADKKLYETQLKLDGLQAEVTSLKALVMSSSPAASPKPKTTFRKSSTAASSTTVGGSRMCTNCDTFVYNTNEFNDWTVVEPSTRKEVDPLSFQYFVSWIESGCPFKENDFLNGILKDDISPCLRFSDETLSKAVYKSVQNNTLAIEPIQSKPKKCSLCYIMGNCPYRIRLADADVWYPISGSCRARIVSVIDFLTFLRYIRQGILKKDINVLYWEMMKHRAEISLARLGMERRVDVKR